MLEDLTPPASKMDRCRVRTVAAELDMADAQRLWDAVNDHEVWSAYALGNALRKRGVQISVNSILRHRNGLCSC